MASRKPKIGLIPAALNLFWDLYPDLKERAEQGLSVVVDHLQGKAVLASPGVIGDKDEAEMAGAYLAKESPDLAVVWESGYVTAEVPMQTLSHLPGTPVALFVTQRDSSVPAGMDYVRYMENTALTGLVELGGSLAKTGRGFKTIVGQVSEAAAYDRLMQYARAAMVVAELKKMNIGMVGYVFPGMMDITVEDESVNRLGPTVTHIPLEEIEARVKAMPRRRVEQAIASVKAGFDATHVHPDDLYRAARLFPVLEDLMAERGVNAFSLLSQHYVDVAADAPPCLALSMMQKTHAVVSGCEGDLGNTISALVLRTLTGRSPMFADWTMFDERENALFFQHCGICDPDIAACPALSPHSENFGFSGDGVAAQVAGKPGPVTMVSLMYGHDGWQMFASEGEAISFDARPCRLNQMMVRVEPPVKEYLEHICNLGLPHHLNIGYGHVATEIEYLASLLPVTYLT